MDLGTLRLLCDYSLFQLQILKKLLILAFPAVDVLK